MTVCLQGTILATLLMSMQDQGQLLQVQPWPFHCCSHSAVGCCGNSLLLVYCKWPGECSCCQHLLAPEPRQGTAALHFGCLMHVHTRPAALTVCARGAWQTHACGSCGADTGRECAC